MKIMNGVYYGKDIEISRYPKATDNRRQFCGYACHCTTCRHCIHANWDYPGEHPIRCTYKIEKDLL